MVASIIRKLFWVPLWSFIFICTWSRGCTDQIFLCFKLFLSLGCVYSGARKKGIQEKKDLEKGAQEKMGTQFLEKGKKGAQFFFVTSKCEYESNFFKEHIKS